MDSFSALKTSVRRYVEMGESLFFNAMMETKLMGMVVLQLAKLKMALNVRVEVITAKITVSGKTVLVNL